jgi:hypothetical protein
MSVPPKRPPPLLRAFWLFQHQPLALSRFDRFHRALVIRQLATVVNKIALCTIRTQVLPAHVMVDAVVAALQ